MKIIETPLPDLVVFEPRLFADERGYFQETWHRDRYRAAGITAEFMQDNISFSSQGTLRGLHFQHPQGQGKLVQALTGEIFDVAVDIRSNSETFGQWYAITLSAEAHNQLYIPPGFAHGFYVLSETAHFSYKCTDTYNPDTEGGIAWDDSEIGIEWPCTEPPILSGKDRAYGALSQIPSERLPRRGDYP